MIRYTVYLLENKTDGIIFCSAFTTVIVAVMVGESTMIVFPHTTFLSLTD